MAITLSGRLQDPFGNALENAGVRFRSARTSSQVLANYIAETTTDSNGDYTISVQFGSFHIEARQSTSEPWYTIARNIPINADTTSTDINSLIVAYLGAEDATPEIVLEIESITAQAVAAQQAAEAAAATVVYKVEWTDSVASMLAKESDIEDGQSFTVASYFSGESRGGGVFTYSKTSSATPDGGTIIAGSSGVFIRETDGLIATPYWYGLPTNSSDVDYTAQMQSLINHPRFALPLGFSVSSATLYPKSNTWGLLQDATIKLLSNQDYFTPVFSLEGAVNGSIYYGGIIDGNRGAESGQGQSGQDGGLHGIRVYSCAGFEWHYPQVNNCATDGVYINAADGESIVGLKIYSIKADNNSRQGLSVINCTDVQFLDGSSWTNTNGKLPEAGIDIEPNNDGEDVDIVFTGKTLCEGNLGRGFVIYSAADGVLTATFDQLVCKNNGLESIRLTGTGLKTVTARDIDCDGNLSLGGSEPVDLHVTGTTKCNRFIIEAAGGADVSFSSSRAHFGAYGFATTTAGNAPMLLVETDASSRVINIGDLTLTNAGTSSSNSYGLVVNGDGLTMKIDNVKTESPRGSRLTGDGSGCFINFATEQDMQSEVCVVAGTGWNVSGVKKTSDALSFIRVDGDFNEIDVMWNGAPAQVVSVNGGTNNSIRVTSKNATVSPVSFNSSSSGNALIASYLHRADASLSLVSDGGTGNIVVGCYPPSINTP